MKERLITGIFIVAIFSLFVYLQVAQNLEVFILLGAFVISVSTFEFIRMYKTKNELSRLSHVFAFLLPLGLFAVLMLINYYPNTYNTSELSTFFAVAVIVMLVVYVFDAKANLSTIGLFMFLVFYISFAFSSLIYLGLQNMYTLLLIAVIPTISDIFAYLGGRTYGKHKLAPTISPNKTIEGSVTGIVFGVAFGMVYLVFVAPTSLLDMLYINDSLTYVVYFVLSLFLSVAGQVGDLVASKLKREFDIKDYSNLMPGHGGILDRFDSVMFCSLSLMFITTMITFISNAV